ncbi:MAG: diguanylate cyclase [Helicobacteraceae bacterium]|nr:diguanylate cyclase [Helicobacteraceae bacterium]
MKRILVVEDNKTLAKLIAKKITIFLERKVDVAYTFAEAKLFLKKRNYFVTLVDTHLLDAPNGEAIDYLIQKEQRIILLSSDIDKRFYKKLVHKNIIDYVAKNGFNDVNHILQTIQRLQANKKHTLLLVESNLLYLKQTKSMLKNMFFDVLTSTHSEDILKILKQNQGISLVLLSYDLSPYNGLELTNQIRKVYTKNELSIIAFSSQKNEHTTATFLKNGANDYIKKPFSKEEFTCRIHNAIEALENIQTITNNDKRNPLTGLYNKRYFYKKLTQDFPRALEQFNPLSIAAFHIDNYEEFQEKYSQEDQSNLINNFADLLRTRTESHDLLAHFGQQEFWIVLRDKSQKSALELLEEIHTKAQNSPLVLEKNQTEYYYSISVGALLSPEETLEESLYQAEFLLHKAKQNGKNQIVYA